MDPTRSGQLPGPGRSRRFDSDMARDVEAYNDALEAEEWARAANIAGNVAVRLEGVDHPDSLTWWERHHECDRRAAEAEGGLR